MDKSAPDYAMWKINDGWMLAVLTEEALTQHHTENLSCVRNHLQFVSGSQAKKSRGCLGPRDLFGHKYSTGHRSPTV